jgi:hypothetical protein
MSVRKMTSVPYQERIEPLIQLPGVDRLGL